MSELAAKKVVESLSERSIELDDQFDHSPVTKYKIKLDASRCPNLPINENTKKIGYSRGLYNKFLTINFGGRPDVDQENVLDVTALGFQIFEKTLLEKLSKREQQFAIKDIDICFGHDLKEIIKCAFCKNVVSEPIKECTFCSKLYCGSCLQSNLRCVACSFSGRSFKNINRISKELAFNKVRFKHVCRPQQQLDQHVLDGLKYYFDVHEPSPELMYLIMNELNILEGHSDNQHELRMRAANLPIQQNENLQKMISNGLWPTGAVLMGDECKLLAIENRKIKVQKTGLNKAQCKQIEKIEITEDVQSAQLVDKEQESELLDQEVTTEKGCFSHRKRDLKASSKLMDTQSKSKYEQDTCVIKDEFWRQVQEMRPKILTYSEYIYHLQNECYNFRPYRCSSQCKQHDMNIHEYKYHLENECQKMVFKCKTCDAQCIRNQIKSKHILNDCLSNLKKECDEYDQVKELNQSLKKQIQEIKDKQDNTGGAMGEPIRRGAEDRFQFFASSSDSGSPLTMTRSIGLSRNRVSRRVRPTGFQRIEQDMERQRVNRGRLFRERMRRDRERRAQRQEFNPLLNLGNIDSQESL